MNNILTGQKNPVNGFLIYQDVILNAVEIPIKISARLAHFDTRDYDSRIYAYERNVLYGNSVPAYYLKGTRHYINIRYSPFAALTIEFRWEQTKRTQTEGFGSGPDAIEGRKKSLITAQLRLKF